MHFLAGLLCAAFCSLVLFHIKPSALLFMLTFLAGLYGNWVANSADVAFAL